MCHTPAQPQGVCRVEGKSRDESLIRTLAYLCDSVNHVRWTSPWSTLRVDMLPDPVLRLGCGMNVVRRQGASLSARTTLLLHAVRHLVFPANMRAHLAHRPRKDLERRLMCSRSSKRSSQQGCRLVVSDVCGPEGPRLLYILQRWLPLVLTIRSRPPHHANRGHPVTAHRHAVQLSGTCQYIGFAFPRCSKDSSC